ncbi:MAG: hypothetical protein R6X19_10695 [Kiritimatiellia bacterium]
MKREATKKRGTKGKQKNAGWDTAYLLRLPGLSVSPAQALLKSDPGRHSVFHAFALSATPHAARPNNGKRYAHKSLVPAATCDYHAR